MADDTFSMDESRKLAGLIARAWSSPTLVADYQRDPSAVLSGAGIELGGRAAPPLPERPAELPAENAVTSRIATSSASSLSTVSCPCTACTASCASPITLPQSAIDAMMKLAEDPEGRARAREITARWGLNLDLRR